MCKYKKDIKNILKVFFAEDPELLEQIILRYAYKYKLVEIEDNKFVLTNKGKKIFKG